MNKSRVVVEKCVKEQGFQRFFENDEVSLKEGLRFAKLVFEGNHITFPNKEQVVLDWLCERLADQLRLGSTEDLQLSWQTFHSILKGPTFQKMIDESVWIALRSKFAKTVMKTLKSKKYSLAFPEILECCDVIMDVPSLASTFTRKYKTFAEFIVIILEILHSSTSNNQFLLRFLNKLLEICLTLQNQQLDQNQVYCVTLNTLFIPVANYLHLIANDKDSTMLKGLLRSVIKEALFHRDHMPIYKGWLESLNEPSRNTLSPPLDELTEFLEQHFSDHNNESDSSRCINNFGLESKGVAINLLLRGFYEKTRDVKENYNCKMLVMLCKQIRIGCDKTGKLQFPAADTSRIQNINSDIMLIALKEMLQVISLNPKAFITQEESLKTNFSLQFFGFLAYILLDFCSLRNASWFQCFSYFLQIHVVVLEANIKKVWRKCLLEQPQMDSDVQTAQDQFLVSLFLKFNQLRRLPFLIDNLIIESKSHNEDDIGLSARILKRFAEICQELPYGHTLDLWETIATHFIELLDPPDFSNLNIIILQLLQIVLLNSRVIDYTVPNTVTEKAMKLFHKIRDNCLEPVMKLVLDMDMDCLRDRDKLKISYLLDLCNAWGHLQLVFCYYQPTADISLGSVHASAWDLSYCQPYLSRKEWKHLNKSISLMNNKQLQFKQWMLLLQKVYALKQMVIDSANMKDKATAALQCQASKLSELAIQDAEDLLLKPTTIDSLENSSWIAFIQEIPLLFEHLPENSMITCCRMIVKIGLNKELRSVKEEMMKIISSDKHKEVKNFQICLINAVFQKMLEILEESERNEEEKNIFKLLHEDLSIWLCYSHKTPKSKEGFSLWNIFAHVAEILNKLFQEEINYNNTADTRKIDFAQITELLKMIELLPLQYLLPGTQTCCLLGVLGIMNVYGTTKHYFESKELIAICQKIFVTILDGIRSIWLFYYIHSGHLLSWLLDFHIYTIKQLEKEDIPEYQENFQNFLESILLLIARDYDSIPHLKTFINKICNFQYSTKETDLETCKTYVKVSSETLKILTMILCKPKAVPVESKNLCYQYINHLGSFLTSLLKTSSFLNLDDQSVIATFLHAYCQIVNVDLKLESSIEKLKWKKMMSEILQFAVFTLENYPFTEVGEASLEVLLTAFLHHKRCRKRFPERFINTIWPLITALYFKKNCELVLNTETNEHFVNSVKEFSKICQQPSVKGTLGKTEDKILNLIATICSTCETSEFLWLLKQLLNLKEEFILNEDTLKSNTSSALNLWKAVIAVNYSQERIKELSPFAQQLVMILQAALGQISPVPQLIEGFAIPVLEIIKNLLKHGKDLLGQHYVGLCLHGCLSIPLHDIYLVSVDLFCQSYVSIHSVLNEMLVHHRSVVIKSLPIYISATTNLLQAVMQASDQTKLLGSPEVTLKLILCAQYIERLLSLLATLKDDVMRTAPYIIATFVGQLETVTVLPAIKEILKMGIHRLLSLCDDHSIRLLKTNLSPSSLEIFTDLYTIYTKYHKFVGKV